MIAQATHEDMTAVRHPSPGGLYTPHTSSSFSEALRMPKPSKTRAPRVQLCTRRRDEKRSSMLITTTSGARTRSRGRSSVAQEKSALHTTPRADRVRCYAGLAFCFHGGEGENLSHCRDLVCCVTLLMNVAVDVLTIARV